MADPHASVSQHAAVESGPGPGATSGPEAAAAADELRHKQQQLNSLALAFLADPANMQRAFAAAHEAAKRGDDSSLKAVYAAAQLARQLEARQLQKRQAEAVANVAAAQDPNTAAGRPSVQPMSGSTPVPSDTSATPNGEHVRGVRPEAAVPSPSVTGASSSSASEDDAPRPPPSADVQQQQAPLQPQQPTPALPPKLKAPVIKLKLSGASLPSRPAATAAQPLATPAVKIELATSAPTQPRLTQSSSSDASISDSDSEQPAQRSKAAAKKSALRVVPITAAMEVRRLQLKRRLGLAPPEGSPFAKQPCLDGVHLLANVLGAAR